MTTTDAQRLIHREVIAAGRTSVTLAEVLRLAQILRYERWKDASIDQLLGLVPVAAQAREVSDVHQ